MADHNEIKMKRMHASAFFEQCVERLELFYAPASQFFFSSCEILDTSFSVL